MASAEREPIMGVCAPSGVQRSPLKLNAFWCCHMFEMALNCYVYELFMVINGSYSTNMCAR